MAFVLKQQPQLLKIETREDSVYEILLSALLSSAVFFLTLITITPCDFLSDFQFLSEKQSVEKVIH